MTKRKLLEDVVETLDLNDVTKPIVQVKYNEQKRTWRQKYDGALSVSIFYSKGGDVAQSTKVFYKELDVTREVLDGDNFSRSNNDQGVLQYVRGLVKYVNVATENSWSKEMLNGYEDRMVQTVARAMNRPQIHELYKEEIANKNERMIANERKEIERAQQAKERQEAQAVANKDKALKARKAKLLSDVKEAVISWETEVLYDESKVASEGLDYELRKDRIRARVGHLVDPNDNLQDRPWFSPNEKPGEWSEFVKGSLGEGFHNKLGNVERDLDEVYITVVEKLQEKALAGETITEDMYVQTFRDTFELDELLDLFERERNVYTDLLGRFTEIAGKSLYNYQTVLEDVLGEMKFSSCRITSTQPGTPGFETATVCADAKTEFETAIGVVTRDLETYLGDFEATLAIVDSAKPDNGDDTVLVNNLSDEPSATAGSFGMVKSKYQHTSGGLYHCKVKFLQTTGNKRDLPFVVKDVPQSKLRVAKPISDAYDTIEDAAGALVETARDVCLEKNRDSELAAKQELIAGWHKYLTEQPQFRKRLFDQIKTRFEGIFEVEDVDVQELVQ